MRTLRHIIAAVLAVTLLAAAGCSANSSPPAAGTVIVDVRTAGEYASGHLDGAINIDLDSSSFSETIRQLDTNGSYIIYCRTGRRSAIAAETMRTHGFTNVHDAGGIDKAADTLNRRIVTT